MFGKISLRRKRMTQEKIACYNETIPYISKQLDNFKAEMMASQSALLAQGFLKFDADRLSALLQSVIATINSEQVVDRPETHPHPVES